MKYSYFSLVASITLSCAANIFAQTPETEPVYDLPAQPVTGSASWLAVDESAQVVDVLSPDAFNQSGQSQLGNALGELPGVHASFFGAGASRPIIRAFSGERVRVLEDGQDIMDLSAASPDHAVPIDALSAERIEILRGPAALRYGSTAVGGVVNVLDPWPADLSGIQPSIEASTQYTTVDDGKIAGLKATVPLNDRAAVRATYGWQDSEDYEIPGMAESAAFHAAEEAEEHEHADEDHEEEEEEASGYVPNTWNERQDASLAGAFQLSEQARLELKLKWYEQEYGVPGHSHEHEHEGEGEEAEEEETHEEHGVHIDLDQWRLSGRFQLDNPAPFLQQLEISAAYADYQHKEIEGDEVATQFNRDGLEVRAEALTLATGPWQGQFGYHGQFDDYKLSGEEAFTPSTDEARHGIFAVESWRGEHWTFTGGLRFEDVSVDPKSDQPDYQDNNWNGSLSANYRFNQNWSASLQYSYIQRSPNRTELYAEGPHLAARQYLIGDADLDREEGDAFETALRYQSSLVDVTGTLFYQDYSDYIAELPSGEEIDGLPVYRYDTVSAVFYGGEVTARWHLRHSETQQTHLITGMDWVRAFDQSNESYLPHTPPIRLRLGLEEEWRDWHLGADYIYAFEQNDTAENEFASDAYNLLRAHVGRTVSVGAAELTLFARIDNLLDEEIRFHTSQLKDLAPYPGRNWQLGAQLRF
ncbi:MAG: iron complex outermembrane recepter protein [Puniceicoccaceae bacterium 5H]|nr:MAG: iron complex outermembrane recepter protein [Puniceicoccaceae bacterium 5H]